MALKIGERGPLDCEAVKGVLDLDDPYAVSPKYLTRARNCFMVDPGNGAGVPQRPGFILQNPDDPLGTEDDGRIGQAVVVATTEDGSQLNFVCNGGKLYRVDATFAIRADVTPVAMPIDPGARVHITPFSKGRMLVNDDLNPPWMASDLSSSPVTGTVIVYSDPGAPWRAYGPARVFDGSAVWVVRFRDDESRTARIAWSEPDEPLTGYFQTGPPAFDDEADIIENDPDTIYAVLGTNTNLDYFRDESIGYLSGVLSEFKSTPTKDAIDDAIGLRAPSTIQTTGAWVWFADREGRVHRFRQDGTMQALWLQHQRVVSLAPTGFFDTNARASCSAIVPELNLYLVALWSPDPTQNLPQFPTTLYAFHADKGTYVGEWVIAAGIAVHSIGVLVGASGRKTLTVLGTKDAAASPQPLGAGGYIWTLSALADGIWTDNGIVPDIIVRTPLLGYDPDIILTVDEAVAVVQEKVTDPTPVEIDIVVD